MNEEEEKLRSSWQVLELEEQQIDQLREEVERMELDKARLSQEQDQCQEKLERGKKLLGKIHVWNRKSTKFMRVEIDFNCYFFHLCYHLTYEKIKNQKVVNFYHYTMQLIFIEIH